MSGRQSLRLVSTQHHHFRQIDIPGLLASRKDVAVIAEAANIASALQDDNMSAVALGDCLDSFGNIVADMPVPPPVLCSSFAHTLRFYIMSHCVKWAPVRRKAPLVSSTASRPCGFTQQTLCKVAYAGPGLSGAGVPRSVPALHAATCRPRVVLSLCV